MNRPKGGGNRLNRINEELKREISNIINYEMSNSNVTGMISVTSVKITPDLRYARVFVSMINSKSIKNTLFFLTKQLANYRRQIHLFNLLNARKLYRGEEVFEMNVPPLLYSPRHLLLFPYSRFLVFFF